ncbi:MAG: c-type cytochrome [Gammaproteobacteria bacterium]|nr:c-type cytochrome [Gammaproteobacteria bacterium]
MTRTSLLSALFVAGLAVGTNAAAADASGQMIAAQCNGCHGFEGKSVGDVSSLHGRSAALMSKAMMDFKSDTRQATIMNRIAKGYSDAEIKNLADYYASLK